MKTIARNHTGHRVGQHHQKAKLTDAQVRAMRKLRDSGYTYEQLRNEFGCGYSTVRDICKYWTRAGA